MLIEKLEARKEFPSPIALVLKLVYRLSFLKLDLFLEETENNIQATSLDFTPCFIRKQAQLQICQTKGAQLKNGRTEMHWKP